MARYPKFCGERNTTSIFNNLDDDISACSRELAAILAHITYETGGKLYDDTYLLWSEFFTSGLQNNEQSNNCLNDDCSYLDTADRFFPDNPSKDYNGRGAIWLRWNGMYGKFSQAYKDDLFDAKSYLLDAPEELLTDFKMSITSAFWLYMTPQFPRPSAHDVMTDLFNPNGVDTNNNALSSFGTTIAIMAQDRKPSDQNAQTEVCLQGGGETAEATLRGELFNGYLDLFELLPDDEIISCADILLDFNGSGNVAQYWIRDFYNTNQPNRCKLVKNEVTAFTIYNPEDYKRCVCDAAFESGDPATECPPFQIPTCGDKEFYNSSSNLCENCHESCETCGSATTCSTCPTGFDLGDNLCLQCESNEYIEGDTCEPCSANCLECESDTVCLTCS